MESFHQRDQKRGCNRFYGVAYTRIQLNDARKLHDKGHERASIPFKSTTSWSVSTRDRAAAVPGNDLQTQPPHLEELGP